MLELPEVLTLANQINHNVKNRQVVKVYPHTKEHKFCWYNKEIADYDKMLKGCSILKADGFGIFVELTFNNGKKLCFNDGVNIRLIPFDEAPKNYQLMIELDNAQALVFTVAMYGGIFLHDDDYDNKYYLASRNYLSPFKEDFADYFHDLFAQSKPALSIKAFLATDQRFPGIGNAVHYKISYLKLIYILSEKFPP